MSIHAITAIGTAEARAAIIMEYRKIRSRFNDDDKTRLVENSQNGNEFLVKTTRQVGDINEYVCATSVDKTKPKTEKPQLTEKRVKEIDKKVEELEENPLALRNLPLLERIDYAIEKLKRGEYISGALMSTLAITYGPEDLREVHSAYKQIKALYGQKNKYIPDYDYKTAQHPFSFFRGSVLHKTMNPFSANGKFSKIKMKLLEWDKTLLDTRLGEKVLKAFDIKVEKVDTPIDRIGSTKDNPLKVQANKFISNSKFGNLTARAMMRVPTIGLAVDGVLEGLEIKEDIQNGKNFFESAGNAVIRLGTSTAITATLGAMGSKAGPIGSLGALTVANYINNTIAESLN